MNTLLTHNEQRLEQIAEEQSKLCRISVNGCGIYEFKLSNGRRFYTGRKGFLFFVESLMK